MAEAGYIKLYRKTEEDELYFKEPFTKWQAWCDLLLLALWKDRQFLIRGILVDGKRGNVYVAQRELALRWKWNKDKVKRFLVLLQNLNKIRTQSSNVIGCISIINYEKYQSNTDTNTNTATDTIEEYKNNIIISSSTAPARTCEENSDSPSCPSSPPYHGGPCPQSPEDLLSVLRSSTIWHESLCMRFHIPRDTLLQHIDTFAADMNDRDNPIGADLSDAKNHFINWLLIHIKKNQYDSNQRKPNDRRRGVEATASQTKDYHSSF